jgi:hypothetical protein
MGSNSSYGRGGIMLVEPILFVSVPSRPLDPCQCPSTGSTAPPQNYPLSACFRNFSFISQLLSPVHWQFCGVTVAMLS